MPPLVPFFDGSGGPLCGSITSLTAVAHHQCARAMACRYVLETDGLYVLSPDLLSRFMREDRLCAAEDDLFRALLRWAIHRAELAPDLEHARNVHLSGGRGGVERVGGGTALGGTGREMGDVLEQVWDRQWMDAWLPNLEVHSANAIHPGMVMQAVEGGSIGVAAFSGGQEVGGESGPPLTADDSGVSAVESASSLEEGNSAMDTPARELKRLQKEVGSGDECVRLGVCICGACSPLRCVLKRRLVRPSWCVASFRTDACSAGGRTGSRKSSRPLVSLIKMLRDSECLRCWSTVS